MAAATVDQVLRLERELEELRNMFERMNSRWAPGALSGKRSFNNIANYNGKPDEWSDWSFAFETFLREVEGWDAVLEKLEKVVRIPTEQEFNEWAPTLRATTRGIENDENLEDMSKQLYQCLCLKLTGNALKGAKNMREGKWSGMQCWVKMRLEVGSMTGHRRQGLAGKVYNPARVTKYVDVLSAIDAWESVKKELERHEGDRKLHDESAIHGLKQLIPLELEKAINATPGLRTYDEVKSYIVEQVALRRDSRGQTQAPQAMDVDVITKKIVASLTGDWQHQGEQEQAQGCHDGNADTGKGSEECQPCGEGNGELNFMNQIMTAVKGQLGGKGFGKYGGQWQGGKNGGGKGQFQGNCSHCGVWGHVKRNCRKLDREMEEYRAGKGKGKGDGKGQQYGKGGYEPKGWGKGGWYSGGKGYGKYGGKAMTLGWGNEGNGNEGWNGGQSGGAWTLNLQKAEGAWEKPVKTVKTPWNIAAPPGLETGGGFDVLTMTEATKEEEEFDAVEIDDDFPQLGDTGNSDRKTRMPPMPNYSKNAVRRAQGRWKPKSQGECHMLTKAPEAKELHPFIGPKPTSDGWFRVKGVMDSGASESVAPPTLCPHYKLHPSPGSRAGQHYVSASEDTIANLGEQYLNIVTDAGKGGVAKYQVADVSRPLNAVSEICDAGGDAGQTVVFNRNGGYIVNNLSGACTEFAREDGVYVLEFWVKPPNVDEAEGFRRQG